MNKVINVKPKTNSQKSHGFREQLRIGREIADQLEVVTPISEVARTVGLSTKMVRRIELRALYKLAMRARELYPEGIF